MKIVLAPDKFKGCLRADEVAQAMAEGIRRVDPSIEIDSCPMADGGEGFVEALVHATGGRFITHRVTGPLPEMKIDATFGILGTDDRTAVIEMAAASGLHLLKPTDYDPFATTTFGTGELIKCAVQMGCTKIILGIGGSATIDAGIGCSQACGFTVLTRDGAPPAMTDPLCGRDLENVLIVKRGRGEVTNGIEIVVACDVTNPLTGPNGAARIYGPQKGATPEQVEQLDRWLHDLAARMNRLDAAKTPGSGAAGGLGFGMLAYFSATLKPGIELVIDATDLRKRLAVASLCLTGEGSLDGQTGAGKTVAGVAAAAHEAGVPCVAVAGSVDLGEHLLQESGLTTAFSICDRPMTLGAAMVHASPLISKAAGQVIRLFRASADRSLTLPR